jgi:penicillin-binding protein 2
LLQPVDHTGGCQKHKKTIKKLSYLLNIKEESFNERLRGSKENPSFKPIKLKTDLSQKEVAILETHNIDLPGVNVWIEPSRFYLYNNLASHILGYMGKISKSQLKTNTYAGYNLTDLIGRCGVEKEFESLLKGKDGGYQFEVDAVGRELRVLSKKDPFPGNKIYLTLDLDIQLILEKSLAGKIGCGIVMNPQNGYILALASSPSFNPNMFSKGISSKEWEEIINNPYRPLENKALQGQYPPGSIFKIVTSLACLEEGILSFETEFNCKGFYKLGRRNFRCWKREGHGITDLHKSLVESCDVYYYQAGRMLGIDKLADYSSFFGLGIPTGISLYEEKKGLVPTRNWKIKTFRQKWQEGETLTIAIGQGFLLTTPIQILNLIASVSNGGILYLPQVIKNIETPDGDIIKACSPQEIRRIPISKENIDFIKDALWGVVNEPHGTGWRAKISGIDVAGKTGTAQVIGIPQGERKKDEDKPFKFRDHAWFCAFAPKDSPNIAVLILIEHGGHGGSVAAPIARDVIAEAQEFLM